MEVYDRKPLAGLTSTGGFTLARLAGALSIEHMAVAKTEPPADDNYLGNTHHSRHDAQKQVRERKRQRPTEPQTALPGIARAREAVKVSRCEILVRWLVKPLNRRLPAPLIHSSRALVAQQQLKALRCYGEWCEDVLMRITCKL